MYSRIKELRRQKGLTQAEFGARIGVKGNTITNYENNLRNPSEAIINSICREFDVSEEWLRTGEGDMFVIRNRNAQIMSFVGDAMKGEESNFQRRLLLMLSKLSVEEWELIERKMRELMGEE